MKEIQPISIWEQGSAKEAVILNAYAVNLTLGQSATFYYALLDSNSTLLAQGNLYMGTEAYLEWGDNDDYAWDWVAEQLNLTIIGDWVPPTTTTTTTEEPISTTSTTTTIVE